VQQLPDGRAASAVTVDLPPTFRDSFLESLDEVGPRLERAAQGWGALAGPSPLPDLAGLDSSSFTRKTAEFCRATTNDHTSVLDFFWVLPVSRQRIQARPNDRLQVEGVLRVILDARVFRDLIRALRDEEGVHDV